MDVHKINRKENYFRVQNFPLLSGYTVEPLLSRYPLKRSVRLKGVNTEGGIDVWTNVWHLNM